MGQAAPVIMAISAVVGAGASIYSGMQQAEAAKQAEELADRNAKLKEAETAEAARRLGEDQKRNQAIAKARAAAAGVGGGSMDTYISDLEKEDRRQLDWLKKSGSSQASIERDRGDYAKTQGMAGAIASFGSAASSAGGAAGYMQDYNW